MRVRPYHHIHLMKRQEGHAKAQGLIRGHDIMGIKAKIRSAISIARKSQYYQAPRNYIADARKTSFKGMKVRSMKLKGRVINPDVSRLF